MIISSEVEEKHFAECILGIFFRKFVFRGGGMNSIILCAIFRIHIAICVALEYFFSERSLFEREEEGKAQIFRQNTIIVWWIISKVH